jgi:hypothetical protein
VRRALQPRAAIAGALGAALLGCTPPSVSPAGATAAGATAAGATAAGATAVESGRSELLAGLVRAHAFDPARFVTHAAHVCSLRLDGAMFPVVDLQEIVRGAQTPRGVNAILVLDAALRPVRRIEYTRERPLFCVDNRLYVWGDLRIDGVEGEGDELTFTDGGRTLALRHVEANDTPAPSGASGPRQ